METAKQSKKVEETIKKQTEDLNSLLKGYESKVKREVKNTKDLKEFAKQEAMSRLLGGIKALSIFDRLKQGIYTSGYEKGWLSKSNPVSVISSNLAKNLFTSEKETNWLNIQIAMERYGSGDHTIPATILDKGEIAQEIKKIKEKSDPIKKYSAEAILEFYKNKRGEYGFEIKEFESEILTGENKYAIALLEDYGCKSLNKTAWQSFKSNIFSFFKQK